MEHIHISALNQYVLCPYASTQDTWPIAIENTYKGEMLNTAVANWSIVDYTPLVNFYAEEIDGNIKTRKTMGGVMQDAAEYIERLKNGIIEDSKLTDEEIEEKEKAGKIKRERDKYHPVYFFQETKMFLRMWDDIIVGTPDLFYYDRKSDEWIMEDFKHASKWWYGNKEITENDCQLWGYPLMIMEAFKHTLKINKVTSRLCLYDNKNGKRSIEWERVVTYEDAKEFMEDVYFRYRESQLTGVYPTNKNPKCNFCPLKKVCGERPNEEHEEDIFDF